MNSDSPTFIPPDKCATLAEAEYRKVGTLGRRQLDAALDVGRLMSAAKEQLEHGKWKPTVQRWRDEGRISFSDRSLRRWMLMAKHADEIKSANLASLTEAEKYAQDLERVTDEDADDCAGEDGTGAKKVVKEPSHKTPEEEVEKYIVRVLQKLSPEKQKSLLERTIVFARQRLELY